MFRWLAFAIMMAAVGTSGYYRRRARAASETISRRREGGVFLLFRALIGFLLFVPVIMYVAAPQRMTWASFGMPEWMRWLGVVVGVLTIPVVSWVLRSLGRNVSETILTKREHEFVTAGPYRWVRHPLYTTGIALFMALGLMLASWFVLFMAVVAALLIRLLVIPAEERELIAKFGDRYQMYIGQAGRLLPRTR